MLAMHLSISADRKLRVATYGLGAWQTQMAFTPVGTSQPLPTVALEALRPNPASDMASKTEKFRLKCWISMEKSSEPKYGKPPPGEYTRQINVFTFPRVFMGVAIETADGHRAGNCW